MTRQTSAAPFPNAKGYLLGLLARRGQRPEFEVIEGGPPHERVFTAQIWLEGELLAEGEGPSKREAEREAAAAALQALGGSDVLSIETNDHAVVDRAVPTVPIYAEVLAEALAIADGRADDDADLEDVAEDAAWLYGALLRKLAEG